MRFAVSMNVQRFVQQMFAQDSTGVPELTRVLIRLQAVQKWFDRFDGEPMAKRDCPDCRRKERIHSIWIDGKYHCLYCLFTQARNAEVGPIPLEVEAATVREFHQMWISYRRCHHSSTIPPQDGWMLVEEKAPASDTTVAKKPRRKSICDVADCAACKSVRPHVLGAGGFKHCFYCLMKQGLRTVPADVQKRPTMDRLNAAAEAAIASLQVQAAAI